MADSLASPGGGSHKSGEDSPRSKVREQDSYLPISNISRIMKKGIPANGKIAKHAKETVQGCVSEFIRFVTSEASDKCLRDNRKKMNGDDLLWAMETLGFEDYVAPLNVFMSRYREDRKNVFRSYPNAQVSLLSRIHHRNLVQFLGYCQEEGKSILVYEFMHNGTLKEHLYGPLTREQSISWMKRLEIAEDAAKGLSTFIQAVFHPSSIGI
ncbi:nuclear transcription factor Y subunit B-1-like [Cornus florida]|uniref:nuclear transcription factor Y subunit B-1-like n=1 Tax=Cornus florida TaxID=4283 RepID=UPI002897BB0C|nr:nuclear transcription factor Y subunit B-1-like [Cornus florida]